MLTHKELCARLIGQTITIREVIGLQGYRELSTADIVAIRSKIRRCRNKECRRWFYVDGSSTRCDKCYYA